MVSAWQQAQQDANDMSDSTKRRMAGLCCYNLLGLVATARSVALSQVTPIVILQPVMVSVYLGIHMCSSFL